MKACRELLGIGSPHLKTIDNCTHLPLSHLELGAREEPTEIRAYQVCGRRAESTLAANERGAVAIVGRLRHYMRGLKRPPQLYLAGARATEAHIGRVAESVVIVSASSSSMPSRKHLLWDASAVISYYLPETAATNLAAERMRTIVDAVRNHRIDVHFLIPNIVVAEVFVAFDRNHYSTWDSKVNKKYGGKGKSLHQRRYLSARDRFRRDITNGALFYQLELNRYHVLGLDLIAPVDKHLKFYRKGNVHSMGAADLLVGAMALHLTRIHGRNLTGLITTDRRMEAIFERAPSNLNANTARDLRLPETARRLGFGEWSGAIYPQVLDVARCNKAKLSSWFGGWPLPTGKLRNRAPKA